MPKEKEEKLIGGSKETIQVETTRLEPTPEVEEPTIEQAELEKEVVGETALPSEALVMVNRAMIETAVKVLGRLTALLTRIEEMDFDENEVEQLITLWTPVIPAISPVLAAVVGTLIIATGKVATYTAFHKREEGKGIEQKTVAPSPLEDVRTERREE